MQAEARRCKEIIDSIKDNPNKLHFCIFDELYSGTNPIEAVNNANAFMNYISKHSNVTFMLTTHYVSLCGKLESNKTIQNYKMHCTENNDNIEFHYTMKKGISYIKGGFKVLNDMNYPKEILDLAKSNNSF
jgi:DNA mismatch repair ATPase MutS